MTLIVNNSYNLKNVSFGSINPKKIDKLVKNGMLNPEGVVDTFSAIEAITRKRCPDAVRPNLKTALGWHIIVEKMSEKKYTTYGDIAENLKKCLSKLETEYPFLSDVKRDYYRKLKPKIELLTYKGRKQEAEKLYTDWFGAILQEIPPKIYVENSSNLPIQKTTRIEKIKHFLGLQK